MLDFHIIIPARLNSTRLANKLMRPLGDKFLLQYTYERALLAGAASVTIATDHPIIAQAMQALGAHVVMTHENHSTGTDRLAEAVDLLGLPEDALIVNLQGDEPLMPVCLIQQVANNLASNPSAAMATLCESITQLSDLQNPSIVKVVFRQDGLALYFSRASIPFDRDQQQLHKNYFRHLGLYAYRASFLRIYQKLKPAPMEQLEKLEQLRALFYGYSIHLELAQAYCPEGVDTLEDWQKIENMIRGGSLS